MLNSSHYVPRFVFFSPITSQTAMFSLRYDRTCAARHTGVEHPLSRRERRRQSSTARSGLLHPLHRYDTAWCASLPARMQRRGTWWCPRWRPVIELRCCTADGTRGAGETCMLETSFLELNVHHSRRHTLLECLGNR